MDLPGAGHAVHKLLPHKPRGSGHPPSLAASLEPIVLHGGDESAYHHAYEAEDRLCHAASLLPTADDEGSGPAGCGFVGSPSWLGRAGGVEIRKD